MSDFPISIIIIKKMIILFEKYNYEFEFSTKYATVADYAFCIYS